VADSRRGERGLLDKSLDLLRDFSDRVQREASRSWKVSGLKAERDGLRRDLSEAQRLLGVEIQRRILSTASLEGGLERHSERIQRLEARLTMLDREIIALEAAELRRPTAAADKPRKSSRAIGARQMPPLPAVVVPEPPETDPLRDILGEAADLVEIEDGQ